jgi:hypothetical protein
LTFEQHQLIVELAVIQQHVEALDAEIAQVIAYSREGRILTSIPGIGHIQAAIILAKIGNIANFDRPAQLKAYCGWAPKVTQSGSTLDRARLTPGGARLLKQTIYLVVWHTLRFPDNEFARLYMRLAPRKCVFDECTREYRGKGKVIGRVAGQLISVMFTLLKRDKEQVAHAKGGTLAAPELYDSELHRRHRAGQYQPLARAQLGAVAQLPPQ